MPTPRTAVSLLLARAALSCVVLVGGARLHAATEPDHWLNERIEAARQDVERAPDFTAQLHLAHLLHLKGSLGDKDAAKRSDAMLQRMRHRRPDHPRLMAYAGSAMMLRAKRAWLPWRKGDLVEEGGALLTRAVARARETPEDDELEVRFVRAASAAELPAWMGQRELARREFAALATVAEAAARDGRLSPYQASSVLYHHARQLTEAGETDEARGLFERAIALAPRSHSALASRRAIAEME